MHSRVRARSSEQHTDNALALGEAVCHTSQAYHAVCPLPRAPTRMLHALSPTPIPARVQVPCTRPPTGVSSPPLAPWSRQTSAVGFRALGQTHEAWVICGAVSERFSFPLRKLCPGRHVTSVLCMWLLRTYPRRSVKRIPPFRSAGCLAARARPQTRSCVRGGEPAI